MLADEQRSKDEASKGHEIQFSVRSKSTVPDCPEHPARCCYENSRGIQSEIRRPLLTEHIAVPADDRARIIVGSLFGGRRFTVPRDGWIAEIAPLVEERETAPAPLRPADRDVQVNREWSKMIYYYRTQKKEIGYGRQA